MKEVGALVFLLAALSPHGTLAQAEQLEAINRATNNLAHEYTQCAAYFSVVSIAMENSNEPETAVRYKEVSDTALEYALGFAEVAGLLPETTAARYEMEIVTMAERIAGNTSNISILGRDYAKPCQVAMEDMDSRVSFWMEAEGVVQ
jgi:hypothetical protein